MQQDRRQAASWRGLRMAKKTTLLSEAVHEKGSCKMLRRVFAHSTERWLVC